MKIVTGFKNENHITSADWQALNQAIIGTGNYIISDGGFSATIHDVTHINIGDGEGSLQGVHFRTERGTTDTVEISPGTLGMNRIDLICARYTKDTNTGVEDVSWAVIEGTETSGTPTDPEYTEGDILGGDTLVDFPLFRVTLTGVTPVLTRIEPEKSRLEVTSRTYVLQKVTEDAVLMRTGHDTITFLLDDYATSIDEVIVLSAQMKSITTDTERWTHENNVWRTIDTDIVSYSTEDPTEKVTSVYPKVRVYEEDGHLYASMTVLNLSDRNAYIHGRLTIMVTDTSNIIIQSAE